MGTRGNRTHRKWLINARKRSCGKVMFSQACQSFCSGVEGAVGNSIICIMG